MILLQDIEAYNKKQIKKEVLSKIKFQNCFKNIALNEV